MELEWFPKLLISLLKVAPVSLNLWLDINHIVTLTLSTPK